MILTCKALYVWAMLCAQSTACEGAEVLGYSPNGEPVCENFSYDDSGEAAAGDSWFDFESRDFPGSAAEVQSSPAYERCEDVPEQCWADGLDTL